MQSDDSSTADRDTVKYFLISAPVDWSRDQYIRRFLLPTGEYVSCVLWCVDLILLISSHTPVALSFICVSIMVERLLTTHTGTTCFTSREQTLSDVYPSASRPLAVQSKTQRSLKKASSPTCETSSLALMLRSKSQRVPFSTFCTRTTASAPRRSKRSSTGTVSPTTVSFSMRWNAT